MWLPQNIKSKGAGAGAASANRPNVTFVRAEDVLVFPTRDAKGVKLVGDFVLKSGAKMFTIYLTPSKQVKNYTSEGDEDMETIKQKFEGWHPGDDLDINEFVQNNLGVGYFIIADNCTDGFKRAYGTPCAPMKLNAEQTDDSSGRGVKMTFEQIVGSKYVPAFYEGNLSLAAPADTDVSVDALQATGNSYKVEDLDTTAAIDINSIDIEHGEQITLIGSGGADPATLSAGAHTDAVVHLKDGTQWTALEDATITLEVFEDGTNTLLIEKNRT
ncbi:MAG: hypothetical protein CMM93_08685 [Rickettsiales bacterium]|mgnify:CR=1 FL=1|nr:hypothetical protein [Rickettsiales bacterium]